ncbi:MAG: TPM domain-containing protein [Bacteroidales bacterium]|nr:TPM domain-containing protein [Bacteroidales bacterium]
MQNAKNFFTDQQKSNIKQAITDAELNTSGEIRVHLENHCNEDVLDRASYLFDKLEMKKTDMRNAVLFYVAVKDKKFAVIGDSGINSLVEENFWEDVKSLLLGQFKNGNFTEGLVAGISKAGEKLKKHFPYQTDDTNELSNEISFE